MYRFPGGNVVVPEDQNEYELAAEEVFYFVADAQSFIWYDPQPIVSSTAVAYRCVEISERLTFL